MDLSWMAWTWHTAAFFGVIFLLLVGMGLDELSLSPGMIPEVKKLILSATFEESRELAKRALESDTGSQVRDLLLRTMRKRFRDMPIWFGDR